MNLIDAVKSGRPYRQKGNVPWIDPNFDTDPLFETREILADNWEIQEPSVTITRTQFISAFGQMYCQPPWDRREVDSLFGIELANKLGLEP